DERRVLQRRGVQGAARRAQGEAGEDDEQRRETAVTRLVALCAAGLVAGGVLPPGQQTQIPEPRKQFGSSVTGAFEGWFYHDDGTRGFLVGYFNRNTQQEIDVPIGPDNRIEPGGPDMGQPTHFLPGRQYGMFVVPVPKSFTADDRLTWTIVANGQSASIPLRLHPDYVIEPFTEVAVGNTPPSIRFEEKGPSTQGPIGRIATAPERMASIASPFSLTVWATDDMKYTSGT